MHLTPDRADLVSAEDLRLRLSGLLPDGARYGRITHLEQVYEALPRDPAVNLEVSTVEIAPGCYNDFHYHNGTAVYILLQGRIEIQFPESVKKYSAGDAYVEPIGIVHRAFNPHARIPLIAVGVAMTAVDRPPIVNITKPQDESGAQHEFLW